MEDRYEEVRQLIVIGKESRLRVDREFDELKPDVRGRRGRREQRLGGGRRAAVGAVFRRVDGAVAGGRPGP